MDLERRLITAQSMQIEEREEGEPRLITGYAALFNSLSQVLWGFREQIAPRAFASSIAADDVRALWNHDTNFPLGRTKNKTLRLEEDDKGLAFEIEPVDTQTARDFVATIERGDVDQMSFGFKTLEDSWDEDDEGQLIRTLEKVKLYEISPVTFPAYQDTEVGVRSLEEGIDPVYGRMPTIPAELRGASGLAMTDAMAAQVRREHRNRQLQILELS